MNLYDFLSQLIRPGITEGGLIIIAVLVTISVASIFVFPRVFAVIKQNAEDTRQIKAQVKNSHPTNLREEQDERHAELVRRLDGMQAGQGALLKGIEGLQQDTRENRKRIDVVGDRLTEHIDESRIIMTRNGIA